MQNRHGTSSLGGMRLSGRTCKLEGVDVATTRRTYGVGVGAEDTTVTRARPQHRVTRGAFEEMHACVLGHLLPGSPRHIQGNEASLSVSPIPSGCALFPLLPRCPGLNGQAKAADDTSRVRPRQCLDASGNRCPRAPCPTPHPRLCPRVRSTRPCSSGPATTPSKPRSSRSILLGTAGLQVDASCRTGRIRSAAHRRTDYPR